MGMKDVLLVVDVLNDFEHEDGDKLLNSLRERQPALVAALSSVRERDIPVIYANDNYGVWDGDARAQVERARAGKGGDLIPDIAPKERDRFIVKPGYSAFDHTPLKLVLRQLETERILLVGMATEMCVTQTAILAREEGFKVTVLADGGACIDEHNERISLEYLERVAGIFVETSSRTRA
jgi:nicotinamidase-related amidase